ncbi:MAG TPA: CYTH and CHAD domain-containing protein [Actinophytocola sp.]|jgi:CHAD domain-containing protein|uniref:CYTH and CHAD domain-containing protein n=1 Tax=Actinophytocola sp. TaxID=1872138 RepID=UPI002F92107C
MRTHTERERKYELPPDAKLPSLAELATTVGPRDDKLEAFYYDTLNLRLIRAGITLRKRTGGKDAGWHLKIPKGTDTREELHFPLGDANTPPDELTALLVGYTRGVPLVPVARIVTHRASWQLVDEAGTELAELTDDDVHAENLNSSTKDHWREVEVELAEEADEALLDRAERALRDAGLRRAEYGSKLARVLGPTAGRGSRGHSAGDHLVAYLAGQVEDLLRYDLLARRDTPDAVHRMRVATRRLRAALRAYRRLFEPERVDRIRAELKWLGDRLGLYRDLEVMEEDLTEAVARLPEELVLGPVHARLTRHFSPARADAQRAVVRTLRTKRYSALLDQLERLVTSPPLSGRAGRKASKELPGHVRRAYRRTARKAAALDGSDERLHDVRKAAKRVRYAAEVAVPAVGKQADKTRKHARRVTKVLGDQHDSVVVRPLVRELAGQAHLAGENGFTFGLLHEQERVRGEAAEAEFAGAWRKLAKKKGRRWLK